MPNAKAEEIIRQAKNDPKVYEEMSKGEADTWSRVALNTKRSKQREVENAASNELKFARNQIKLEDVLKKHGLEPKVGLSLGCGPGRAERRFMKTGICQEFHGIDISEDSIKSAKASADEEGLNITYDVQDINFLKLEEGKYDLVVAITSLHHLVQLEHVADEIAKSLSENGVLWIHEYVGETQFQYTDERIKIVNDILDRLPADLRFDNVADKLIPPMSRKEPGTLISPFESIRSGDIQEVFGERFETIEKQETRSIMQGVVPVGTRQNYLYNTYTRAIFELLAYFDQLLIDEGALPAQTGQYLMRRKR